MDPGINKPFDRAAKDFAEEAPLLLLRLLGMIPPGEDAALERLRPETAPTVVMPDYVATLSRDGKPELTIHVEFFLVYKHDIPSWMARYGGSLAWQYRRPVQSVLVMLRELGVPDEIPAVGEYVIGETRMTHPFRTVRLWEVDPGPVLATGDPALLPWALLMRLGREEAVQLGSKVARTNNDQWRDRFLTLGSLRYDRSDLEEMLGGPKMGLVEAIIEGSSIVQEERAKAAAEGEALGLLKGRAEAARHALHLVLAERFPGLESLPAIDLISNVADLESLFLRAIRESERTSIEQAILAAGQKHS